MAEVQPNPPASMVDTAMDETLESYPELGGGILEGARRLNDAPISTRARRLSDPSNFTAASPESRPLPVRSRDGSRWLPAPEEQSHRRGSIERRSFSDATTTAEAPLQQHACTAAVCAVTKLFETTELLEAILSFLGTKHVLSLRRVNKHWNTTVQSSPYLRLHFFTYPQWERPSSEYRLLPLSLPGIGVERGEPIHLGQWIEVKMTPDAARRICPEPKQRVRSRSIFEGLRGGLGRSSNDAWPAGEPASTSGGDILKYEDLQITQPPILGMQAYLLRPGAAPESASELSVAPSSSSIPSDPPGERSDCRNSPRAIAKLSCDAGITLGFLAETAQDLLGPARSVQANDPSARVVFKAIISFTQHEGGSRRGTRRNLRTLTRIG